MHVRDSLRLATVVVIASLAACEPVETAPDPLSTTQQALFDCQHPSQRLECPAPADPRRRFICHGTGSDANPYNLLTVPPGASHTPGIAHGNGARADQQPGASADDTGDAALDCDCDARACPGVCTGAPAGAACDDADRCTGEGACDGDACQPGAPVCVAGTPVDVCLEQSGVCVADTGECVTSGLPEGTPCGGGLVCDGDGGCVRPARVVVNEVESSGGVPGDWIELSNDGDLDADLSGWRLLDNDDAHAPYVFPQGTRLAPGAHVVVDEAALGFGLGSGDTARLFDDAGTLVDAHTWRSHAVTTYGRCPDGEGAMTTTTSSTKGAPNDCRILIRINEVESSGGSPGDWAELYNAGPFTVDLSGWTFKDNDDTRGYVIPAGTSLAAGAYLVLDEAVFGFGLGSNDQARLFDASGALVDGHAWIAHAAGTYGRCPNGTGDFATNSASSKGVTNVCAGGPSGAAPWPGRDAVVTADGVNVFGQNLSDSFYEPGAPNVLWAVRNGPETLFRVVFDGATWSPTASWRLRYPNGAGQPDAEGVTKAELTSAIYVASERDNAVSGVSRLGILRYDTAIMGAELAATHEWNLTADLPPVGPNIGFEAIRWAPDSFLVANGFLDERAGRLYDPLDYPNHGSGLFLVGVEATGAIHVYALDHVGGGFARIATIASGSGSVKGLELDRDVGYLWAYCGANCGNESGVLSIDRTAGSPTLGRFVTRARFARPTTMPNINNEGIAIAPESQCVNGFKPFYWSDDGNTDGHALRADAIRCGAFIP